MRRVLDENEFDRNHIAALMQHLKVRVLAVRARLAPDHRAGGVRQCRALQIDVLAVAFHLQLLQVGRQTLEPLVIRSHAAAREVMEVAIPDVDQPQQQRQVLRRACGGEVFVHRVRAVQQRTKVVTPDRQRNRQPDG